MAVAIIDMNAVDRGLDAKIPIAHALCERADLLGRAGQRLDVVKLVKPRPIALRQATVGARRTLSLAAAACSAMVRRVWGLTCTTGTVPISSSEQMPINIAVMPGVSASVSSVRLPVPIMISAEGRSRRSST